MFKVIQGIPSAHAAIKGSETYESIRGNVYLYEVYGGTVLMGEIYGIPPELERESGGFYGFHIHEGGSCTGNSQDEFADAKSHYNPKGCLIPGMRVIFRR